MGNRVLSLVYKPTGDKLALFVERETPTPARGGFFTRLCLAASRMADGHMGKVKFLSQLPDNPDLSDFAIDIRQEYPSRDSNTNE